MILTASRLLCFAALLASCTPSIANVPCSALSSPGTLRIVTFDVFAALMQTEASLNNATASAIPQASSSDVTTIVNNWINCYGSYASPPSPFDPTSQTPQPFPWVMHRCLWQALNTSGYGVSDGPGTPAFATLVLAWSTLTPYDGTAAALQQLANAGLLLGALSNGDRQALANATSVFLPGVRFWRVFPSDYPVGVFKPDADMYAQVAHAAAEMGWGPDAILHAAGSPTDAQGARKYGLLSVLIAHGNSPDPPPDPCAVFQDISSLPGYLNVSQYPPLQPSPGPYSPASAAATGGAGVAPGPVAAIAMGVAVVSVAATLAVTRALAAPRGKRVAWATSKGHAETVVNPTNGYGQ